MQETRYRLSNGFYAAAQETRSKQSRIGSVTLKGTRSPRLPDPALLMVQGLMGWFLDQRERFRACCCVGGAGKAPSASTLRAAAPGDIVCTTLCADLVGYAVDREG